MCSELLHRCQKPSLTADATHKQAFRVPLHSRRSHSTPASSTVYKVAIDFAGMMPSATISLVFLLLNVPQSARSSKEGDVLFPKTEMKHINMFIVELSNKCRHKIDKLNKKLEACCIQVHIQVMEECSNNNNKKEDKVIFSRVKPDGAPVR